MSQLRKLNQTQTKEKGVAVVTPQRSYSNLLEDLIKDIVASNIILLISVLPFKFFLQSQPTKNFQLISCLVL